MRILAGIFCTVPACLLHRRGAFATVAAILCMVVAGCGQSFRPVPVSGKVEVNRQPMAGVVVTFQPQASGKGEAGPGSVGVTDSQGRYTLELVSAKKQAGAVPGKHRVTFAMKQADRDTADDSARPAPQITLPAKEFEVPAAGTDKADFSLDATSGGGGGGVPARQGSGRES